MDPDALRPPDPRMISFRPTPRPDASRQHPHLWVPPRVDSAEAGDTGVRPFIITGGRTAPADYRLRIETQVVATRNGASTALDGELRRIIELCQTPLAVAEIGAALGLPLGVARVLVADLAMNRLVVVHGSTAPASRVTIERILERVHGL